MSLARFYSRIDDAISPLLGGTLDVRSFLAGKTICLEAPDNLEQHPDHLAGFILTHEPLRQTLSAPARYLAPKRCRGRMRVYSSPNKSVVRG